MAMNMSKTSMSQGQMNIRQATSNILAGRSSVCGCVQKKHEEEEDNCCLTQLKFFHCFFCFLLSLSHSLFALFQQLLLAVGLLLYCHSTHCTIQTTTIITITTHTHEKYKKTTKHNVQRSLSPLECRATAASLTAFLPFAFGFASHRIVPRRFVCLVIVFVTTVNQSLSLSSSHTCALLCLPCSLSLFDRCFVRSTSLSLQLFVRSLSHCSLPFMVRAS